MNPFWIEPAASVAEAIDKSSAAAKDVTFIAGGTNIVDMMKMGVTNPKHLVDILPLRATHSFVEVSHDRLRIGALATMSEIAKHPKVKKYWPALVSAILQSASPQIRNAATSGGNLLQRTRCSYFRDYRSACNKRVPGSGCSAIGGETRELAILGTSRHCIANYPGDMAVALTLFETTIRLESLNGGARTVPICEFYLLPGSTPDRETELQEGELITEISIARGNWDTSIYLKLRDRESYAFALASVAVAVKLKGNIISDLRVVVGGLAARPWRCLSIENAQRGQILNPRAIEAAARLLFADADLDEHRAFKVELGIRGILRALNLAVSQSLKSV